MHKIGDGSADCRVHSSRENQYQKMPSLMEIVLEPRLYAANPRTLSP